MPKFRKKSVVSSPPTLIEAEQYTGVPSSVRGLCQSHSCFYENRFPHVHTINQGRVVELEEGDWIIPEPDGEHFYPCKPDIFEATYEPVEEKA